MLHRADPGSHIQVGDATIFTIMSSGAWTGHAFRNGYVRMPKRLREESYDGIVAWVNVHGGITYAKEDGLGIMVYGFDTNHVFDDHTWDIPRVQVECRRMLIGLRLLEKYEKAYRLAEGVFDMGQIRSLLRDQYESDVQREMVAQGLIMEEVESGTSSWSSS